MVKTPGSKPSPSQPSLYFTIMKWKYIPPLSLPLGKKNRYVNTCTKRPKRKGKREGKKKKGRQEIGGSLGNAGVASDFED